MDFATAASAASGAITAAPEAAAAPGWLNAALVYLGAAVLAVPLARLLGLGAIIGYLAAGMAIGPWGLALVSDPAAILQFAEFGVVLMLFLVGLELEPRRLWALRGPIFGWGTVQVAASTALVAAVALALGTSWQVAVVAGLALAMSSTAIGLGVLQERNLGATGAGRSVLSVSLFQDIAAIPILALLPLLAAGGAAADGGGWIEAGKAAAMVAAIVFGGRLLLRPALRWIAGSRTPEVFTAAALLLVVATAALMQAVGLSMALGAFLAGVLLAESEYRRALETDLAPFKGLLLGLFFIAVGMSIDFGAVLAQPLAVLAVVTGFLVLKALVVLAMARGMGIAPAERTVFVVLLANGGEFGFVVLQGALAARAIDAPTASLLLAAIALAMLLTPLLLVALERAAAWRLARRGPAPPPPGVPRLNEEPAQDAPVLIAGFGRYGQTVGRLLHASGLRATVLEHDAEQVELLRRFGWKTFWGDATRLDLLKMAGAAQARVLVIAIDDMAQSVALAKLAREHFPQLTIVARARNVSHYLQLRRLGVTLVERETLDSSLMSARSVLELLGWKHEAARTQALRFRRHNVELVEQMVLHAGDETQLVALARQGRQQLEQAWAQERAQAQSQTHPPADPEARRATTTAATASDPYNAPPASSESTSTGNNS